LRVVILTEKNFNAMPEKPKGSKTGIKSEKYSASHHQDE